MLGAWDRLELAPALAAGASELAYVHELRGRILRSWGLSHEAFLEFATAARMDPASPEAASGSRQMAEALGLPWPLPGHAR
jgi:hypothetical protein